MKKVDASSKYQSSLPVTSDDLLTRLDQWKISYKCHNHAPVDTVEEYKKIQNKFLISSEGGGHIKNLYLRDHKKNNFLIVVEQDIRVDLKFLKNKINSGRLSFGSSERLMENLGVRPGAVTPFAMINGVKHNVSLFLDNRLKSRTKIYAHPMVNDKTLELSINDLEMFFEKVGAQRVWVDF